MLTQETNTRYELLIEILEIGTKIYSFIKPESFLTVF